MEITILDGAMGTELAARGVPTPEPGWSAHALTSHPDRVREVHARYAAAGATVHTAATFRTRRRVFPENWADLARLAVQLAREAVPPGHRVAGSVAPLEDCFRPDLSPAQSDPEGTLAEHRELAEVLADAGCDLLLCETFPSPPETLLAARACIATGVETWVSFTPGFKADLLTPVELARAAREAAREGAEAVLANCVPATRALDYIRELAPAAAEAGVVCGVYANAGEPGEGLGWGAGPDAARRYADLAEGWAEAGARIIGGCCGTGPEHIRELAARFQTG